MTLTRCRKRRGNTKRRPCQAVRAVVDDGDDGVIPEKALKGRSISNHVKSANTKCLYTVVIRNISLTDTHRFGDFKSSDAPVAVHGVTYPYRSGKKPIAMYVFNYCSRSTYPATLCPDFLTPRTHVDDEISQRTFMPWVSSRAAGRQPHSRTVI